MAWPLTPFRTMTDGTSKWDEALGNALQAGVNQIVAGTTSLIGVAVDGVGGVTVVAEAGAVIVSKTVSGTAAPTAAYTKGAVYKDSCVLAVARVFGNGTLAPTLVWGFNVASVTRNGVGDYIVTLNSAAASASHILADVAPSSPTNGTFGGVTINAGNYTASSFHVYVTSSSVGSFDLNGGEFVVVVYGA